MKNIQVDLSAENCFSNSQVSSCIKIIKEMMIETDFMFIEY